MSQKQGVMPGFVPGIHDFLLIKDGKLVAGLSL